VEALSVSYASVSRDCETARFVASEEGKAVLTPIGAHGERMSTVLPKTTQTVRTERGREARSLRRGVAGIVASGVLAIMQAAASRHERRTGIDREAEW
jgi:hypothetical protein